MELEGFAGQAWEMANSLITLINKGIIWLANFIAGFLSFPEGNIYILVLALISLWIGSNFSDKKDLKFFVLAGTIFLVLFMNKTGGI